MLLSSRRLSTRRVVPRYCKGYIWVAALILIFVWMIALENGWLLDIEPMLQFSRPSDVVHEEDLKFSYKIIQEKPLAKESIAQDTSTQLESHKSQPSARNVSPEDVLIIVKTGATALWRRLPIHLSTTLVSQELTPHVAIYSDSPDHIGSFDVIDALANVSASLKKGDDFKLHDKVRQQYKNNLYLESTSMEGDSWLSGGWRLDKYKFLPIFAHAAKTWPQKKWYVLLEDDNYIFWQSLYQWLDLVYGDEDRKGVPLFIGSPAYRLGEDFAHGGSGFAVNQAAMHKVFGEQGELGDELVREYESYMEESCCGDQILSHVFAENGVTRDKRFDDTGIKPLQSLPLFRLDIGDWNVCSPLLNIHKVHARDISQLWNFEAQFHAGSKVIAQSI